MKSIFSTFIALVLLTSCGQTQTGIPAIQRGSSKPGPNEAVATFAEGCFWHTEIVFQSLEGVRDAVSGYAGGSTPNPDYETVSEGKSGHAEAVNVYYDPSKISFETLVAAFFASQDPTTPNRQGNDVGPQYRSIAFYRNEKEKQIIENEIRKLTAAKTFKNPIVTEVMPFTKFYAAEKYHQEYISDNPGSSYVRNVSIPDYLHFRKTFKGPFKD